jgi:hypothetical protein
VIRIFSLDSAEWPGMIKILDNKVASARGVCSADPVTGVATTESGPPVAGRIELLRKIIILMR